MTAENTKMEQLDNIVSLESLIIAPDWFKKVTRTCTTNRKQYFMKFQALVKGISDLDEILQRF